MSEQSAFRQLLGTIEKLQEAGVYFKLSADAQPNSIMIEVAIPGERWEIEFFESEPPQVEIFRSDGQIFDSARLQTMLDDLVVARDQPLSTACGLSANGATHTSLGCQAQEAIQHLQRAEGPPQ